MTRLLSFGAIWIFYVQVIGGNKSLCPSGETVAANSMHGTPFLAFKLGFCRHSGNLNRGRSVRRMSFCMHTEGGNLRARIRLLLSALRIILLIGKQRKDMTEEKACVSAEWKETEHVLSYSNPMGGRSTQSTAELAVEINGPQFTAGPVSNSSALWPSAARSSAGLFLLITGESGGAARAREQRTQLPFGHGSTIPPAADDSFPRGDMGNAKTWSTNAPGDNSRLTKIVHRFATSYEKYPRHESERAKQVRQRYRLSCSAVVITIQWRIKIPH